MSGGKRIFSSTCVRRKDHTKTLFLIGVKPIEKKNSLVRAFYAQNLWFVQWRNTCIRCFVKHRAWENSCLFISNMGLKHFWHLVEQSRKCHRICCGIK